MQPYLLRYLLCPIILSTLSDALFHQSPYLPRQSYVSILHPVFDNPPHYQEHVDRMIHNEQYSRPFFFFNDNNPDNQQDEIDAGSRIKTGIEYPDAQLRINKQDNPQRFLFAGNTFNNPFWKTATYTLVSSLNVTNVQNCIPSSLFINGGSTVNCRRKKRETPSAEDNLQFSADPSKPQEFTATVLPFVDLIRRDDRQLRTPIMSSKDEGWQERQDLNKEKRFLHYYVATTTAYSYILSTYYSTRTIKPLQLFFFYGINCLPNGYVIC